VKRRHADRKRARKSRALKTATVHARIRPENLIKLRAMARRAGTTPSSLIDAMIEVHERAELEMTARAERAKVEALNASRDPAVLPEAA
jgi:hypothetical protein